MRRVGQVVAVWWCLFVLSLCVVAVTMLKIVCVPNRTIIIGWWNLNARCGAIISKLLRDSSTQKTLCFFDPLVTV